MRLHLFTTAALLLLMLPGTAAAQTSGLLQPGLLTPAPTPPGIVQPAPAASPRITAVGDDRIAFNSTEQWMIPLYFQRVRETQKRAARSKRYVRAMPAGLTQSPAKGDQLSQSVLTELTRLPAPLVRDLPPARPGTDRVIVGNDVMMVSTANGAVLDILSNIIF